MQWSIDNSMPYWALSDVADRNIELVIFLISWNELQFRIAKMEFLWYIREDYLEFCSIMLK